MAPPRSATAAAVFLAGAVVLLGQTLAVAGTPARAVAWGGLAFAAYATALLCLAAAWPGTGLGLTSWRFGPWTLLWYGVTFGLATLTFSKPQTGTVAQIALPSVLRALGLVTIGITLWALGYWAGPRRHVARLATAGMRSLSRRFGRDVRSPAAPWILYLVGSAARVASAATSGRFGYVGDAASAVSTTTGYAQALSLLALCAPLAVAAAAVQVFRERAPGARITLTVLFVVELLAGAAAGNKENFVVAALAVVIPYSAERRKLPVTGVALAGLAFLLVVIPFNVAYRSADRGGPATLTPAQAIDVAPAIFRQTVTGHNMAAVLPLSVGYLLQRIREIDTPAIILQRTPGQIGFRSPAELIDAPLLGLVPRAIWPGKPILATGYQVNQSYYGLPATLYTSAAITPVGDLYRHGGWLPVVTGMFLLGCAVRLLDDVLDVRTNPHAIFLVLLLFPSLVLGEKDWVTLLADVPEVILVWLLAVCLTFRPRRMT